MSFEYFQELASDLEKLLATEIGYDVVIYAGENENMKELHAHSPILCTRSQYFYTTFSNEWAEKKEGKFVFKKPNISPRLFKIIIRFIYCGKIDLTALQCTELLELLMAVDELNIQELIPCVQKYLIEHQDKFLQQNPTEILEKIYQYELFTDLLNYCLEKICDDPEILLNSDKFINLKAPLLELLLKRDDLPLDEIDIWNSLLKWGLAQNPSISQDITKCSKEEITIMERTLHRFIPLIRFYHISSDDFLDKIYPLKKLLPEDLVNDIMIFHIAPNRKPDIQPPRQSKSKFGYGSVLVEPKHFSIFSSWIEKKNDSYYNVRNIPYGFNLLYCASRDGNNVAVFHAKCENKGATIVVVKIKDLDQIIGGYNPLYWSSDNNYMSTNDSFIFLFTDKKNTKTAKVCYSNGDQWSVGNYLQYGPLFGRGSDLACYNDGRWYNNPCSYPKLDGILKGFLNVDDYEVFQVIKK